MVALNEGFVTIFLFLPAYFKNVINRINEDQIISVYI